MEQRRETRRGAWALVLSLVVHALLFIWVVYFRAGGPPLRGPSQAIEVQIVEVVVPKEKEKVPQPASVHPERTRKPSDNKKKSAPIEAVVQPEPVAGEANAPARTAEVTPRDAPRTVTLQPSLGVVLPGLGTGERELSKGHTVVNGPGEEPDAVAMREYTEEKIKRRLDDDFLNAAASARMRSGLLDPYFSKLSGKMNDGLGKAGVDLRDRTPGEILREEVVGTWQDSASRYGKDGNPLGSADEERRVVESGLGREVAEGRVPGMGSDVNGQREMAKAMQQFGAMEALVASAQRARLRTVIEFRQDRDGALAEAVFIERSGDAKFDEFVLHQGRKVVREQGEVEDPAETPYKEGWRTVWAFTWEPPKVKAKLLRVLRGQPAQPLLLPRP